MERRKIVAIIGDAKIEKDSLKYQMAFEMGKALIDAGYRIQTGGMSGVMRAASEGAKTSKNYKEGDIIAIVPSFDVNEVNEFADIVIPTGLDVLRNALVANASAVVAIGGGAGTLTEMGFAWSFYRLVLGFCNVDGWSKKLANQKIDERVRYENLPDDKVFGVESAEQAISILNEKIDLYTKRHKGIVFQDGMNK